VERQVAGGQRWWRCGTLVVLWGHKGLAVAALAGFCDGGVGLLIGGVPIDGVQEPAELLAAVRVERADPGDLSAQMGAQID
jgi:hypothetical protein